MTSHRFTFADLDLIARPSGALLWASGRVLVVADLHLGKSARMARRGGALLPPYEGAATLARLRAEVAALDPALLICLGDSFDDSAASETLSAADQADLSAICAGRGVIWIAGNHDPHPSGLPGRLTTDHALNGVSLRHIAGQGPDISGHYHPKARLAGVSRPAFVIGTQHLILPAFGAYTGGLDLGAPALCDLVPSGLAVLTGAQAIAVPITALRGPLCQARREV